MTPARYSTAAIALHWAIAAALAFQISLGWRLEGPSTPQLFSLFQLHKSVGITILVLSLARLALRLTLRLPRKADGPPALKRLASAVHTAFYAVMIGGPLTGWLIVSTARIKVPTLIFGVIPLPHLPVGAGLHDIAEQAHELIAWLAIALFVMHVAGALRHQWLLGDNLLARMIPGVRGRAIPAVLAAFGLVFGAMAVAKMVGPSAPAPPAPVVRAQPAQPPAAAPVPATPPPVEPVVEAEAPVVVPDWRVRPGGTLGFTASWNGEAVRGSFSRWRSTIAFSPQALDRSSIRVVVDLASADTSDSQRDDSLKGTDFFDTANHASAIFTSRTIRHRGGNRYEASGDLALKSISRPNTLRFTLDIDGNRADVRGTATIDRTRHQVGTGEWAATDAIAADVAVNFRFTATAE